MAVWIPLLSRLSSEERWPVLHLASPELSHGFTRTSCVLGQKFLTTFLTVVSVISSQTTLLLFAAYAPNESMTWDFRTMLQTALSHFEHKKPTLMTSIIDLVFIDICLRGRMSLPTMQREFFMDMVSFYSAWSFTFFMLVARVRTNLSAVFEAWRNEVTALHILDLFMHS